MCHRPPAGINTRWGTGNTRGPSCRSRDLARSSRICGEKNTPPFAAPANANIQWIVIGCYGVHFVPDISLCASRFPAVERCTSVPEDYRRGSMYRKRPRIKIGI